MTKQFFLSIRLPDRIHLISLGHRLPTKCFRLTNYPANPSLPRPYRLVPRSWSKHSGWIWSGQEPRGHCSVSSLCLLRCDRVPLLYQLKTMSEGGMDLENQLSKIDCRSDNCMEKNRE